jgi:hypothetical protein
MDLIHRVALAFERGPEVVDIAELHVLVLPQLRRSEEGGAARRDR